MEASIDKNSNILLILCPPWGIHEPHLGLAYLSTYVKQKGYSASVLDINISIYNQIDSHLRVLWQAEKQEYWVNRGVFYKKTLSLINDFLEEYINIILNSGFKILGFSVVAGNRLMTIEMVKRIKKRDKDRIIIIGGLGVFTESERLMFEPGTVDVFVVGEGEETLKEILYALDRNGELQKVNGAVTYDKDGKSWTYIPRPLIKNLDDIPYPTYDEFDLDQYYYSRKSLDEFTMKHLPLIISRGCVGRCKFCNDRTLWTSFRFRSAQHIFEEIRYEVDRRNITSFVFQDLTGNGNLQQLEQLCDLLIDWTEKYIHPLQWVTNAIARKEMKYELLVKMRKAGCHTLMFGIESGSDTVLRLMSKGFNSQIAGRVLKDCKRAGINTWVNIIVGYPGEGEKEFEETIEFIKNNREYIDKIQNLNTCNVVYSSELEINKDWYGIVFPENDMSYLTWYTKDGTNTYEKRIERHKRLSEILCNLGLSPECTNKSEISEEIL